MSLFVAGVTIFAQYGPLAPLGGVLGGGGPPPPPPPPRGGRALLLSPAGLIIITVYLFVLFTKTTNRLIFRHNKHQQ